MRTNIYIWDNGFGDILGVSIIPCPLLSCFFFLLLAELGALNWI